MNDDSSSPLVKHINLLFKWDIKMVCYVWVVNYLFHIAPNMFYKGHSQISHMRNPLTSPNLAYVATLIWPLSFSQFRNVIIFITYKPNRCAIIRNNFYNWLVWFLFTSIRPKSGTGFCLGQFVFSSPLLHGPATFNILERPRLQPLAFCQIGI